MAAKPASTSSLVLSSETQRLAAVAQQPLKCFGQVTVVHIVGRACHGLLRFSSSDEAT